MKNIECPMPPKMSGLIIGIIAIIMLLADYGASAVSWWKVSPWTVVFLFLAIHRFSMKK